MMVLLLFAYVTGFSLLLQINLQERIFVALVTLNSFAKVAVVASACLAAGILEMLQKFELSGNIGRGIIIINSTFCGHRLPAMAALTCLRLLCHCAMYVVH